MNAGTITIGSLIPLVRQYGYQPPHERIKAAQSGAELDRFDLSRGRTDMQQAASPPPRDWVQKDLLPAGKAGVLTGFGGTSKTMFAIHIAIGLAIGRDFTAEIDIPPGASLLVLGEEDQEERDRRVGAVLTHMQAPPAQWLTVAERVCAWPMAGVNIRLTDMSEGAVRETVVVDAIIARAKEHAEATGLPVRLIVIDHARLVAGGDLNSGADATVLTREVTRIANETGAAVLLITHTPKAAINTEDPTAHQMVAHSGAFVDNTRFTATLATMSDKQAKKFGKDGPVRENYVQLVLAKSNYSRTGEVCWFKREPVYSHQVAVLERVDLQPMPKPGRAASWSEIVLKAEAAAVELVVANPGKYQGNERLAGAVRSSLEDCTRDHAREGVVKAIAAGRIVMQPLTEEDRKKWLHGRGGAKGGGQALYPATKEQG
jgi:KaiC/GvpD/RAD55 family RecA-like ATPase